MSYRPRYHHCRYSYKKVKEAVDEAVRLGQIRMHAHGYCRAAAVTVCLLEDENRKKLSTGFAFCSTSDNFSRKKGRDIALARATEWLKRSGDNQWKVRWGE